MKVLLSVAILTHAISSFSQSTAEHFTEALSYSIHFYDSNHVEMRKILIKGEFEYDTVNSDRITKIYASKKNVGSNQVKYIMYDKYKKKVGFLIMGDYTFNKRLIDHLNTIEFIKKEDGKNYAITIANESNELSFRQEFLIDQIIWFSPPEVNAPSDWNRFLTDAITK